MATMWLMLNFSNNWHKTCCMPGYFLGRWLRFCHQNCKIKNGDYVTNVEFFEQLTQNLLYAWVFFGSLITILKSELENSKSRVRIGKFKISCQNCKIRNGGYISANSQFFRNCAETWYMRVFGVADHESGARIVKFKREDWKWRWC